MKVFSRQGDYGGVVVASGQQEVLIFVFIGPPGSGKGTLATRCADQLGIPTLSTGNLCRAHIEQGTSLGKKFSSHIDKGGLIPDLLISEMVVEWILEKVDANRSCILDGFPRTIEQARLLNEFVTKSEQVFNIRPVIFEIAPHVLIDRLLNRKVCVNKSCQAPYSPTKMPKIVDVCDLCGDSLVKRKDDAPDVINHRLAVYQEHAQDLIPYFMANYDDVHTIDAQDLSIDEVYDTFSKLLP